LRSEGFLADAHRIATARPTQPPLSAESRFPAPTCKSAGGWPGDDRDLLVIEEEVVDPMPIESDSELPVDFAEEANQAYLQLFSRLRQ
jgi:hypothetical protein